MKIYLLEIRTIDRAGTRVVKAFKTEKSRDAWLTKVASWQQEMTGSTSCSTEDCGYIKSEIELQ